MRSAAQQLCYSKHLYYLVRMKMKWITLVFGVLFSLALKAEAPRSVLVLHSYHQGLMWTDRISKGIAHVFAEYPECEIEYRYLNARRTPEDSILKKQKEIILHDIKNYNYKAIIASDNAAYDFLKTIPDSLLDDMPVVCCGVNGRNILPFSKNSYIIKEKVDYAEAFTMISDLMPNLETLMVLNDRSPVGLTMQEEIEYNLKSNKFPFDIVYYNDFSMDELLDSVSHLPPHTALYLLVFNVDNKGSYVSYNYAIRSVVESATVPVFGAWTFYMNKGVVGGKMTSGQNHGRIAAEVCLKALSGEEILKEDLEVENKYRADYQILRKHGLKLSDLPQSTYIHNRPDRKLFVRLFYAVLLVFIIFLFVYQRNEKYLKRIVFKRTRELKLALNHKDQFFSLLAHDLRSPIGNLSNSLHYLEQKGEKLSPQRKALLLRELTKTSSRVYHLLEDLLIWGRFQFSSHYEAQLSVFKLKDLVDDVCEVYYLEKNKSLFINEVPNTIELHSDAFVLKFIFRNLISNAIKFSPDDAPITIGADTFKGNTRFWVRDEGQGMTKEVINSIVNKSPIQSEGVKGQKSFGLGLRSVQAYLTELKAEMSIESTPGKGSCFFITLS